MIKYIKSNSIVDISIDAAFFSVITVTTGLTMVLIMTSAGLI